MIISLYLLLLPKPVDSVELTVLAASSLRAPLNRIASRFEAQNPTVKLRISYAGSQQLAAQINLGAPADLFLSADCAQMDAVLNTRSVDAKEVHPFASNRLALLISKSADTRIRSVNDLDKDNVSICVGAKTVPVGAYTLLFLAKATKDLGSSWRKKVNQNIVSMENNVSSIVSRVELDEVDAGFVYQTDARLAKRSVTCPIPKSWNVSALYLAAVIKASKHKSVARKVSDAIRSKEGQTILNGYGFLPPK